MSKLRGSSDAGMPPFVGLSPKTGFTTWGDPGPPGFLGQAHASFRPENEGKADMVLNNITLNRLEERKSLLGNFDRFRREADASGLMEGMDACNKQAFGVLTSNKLAEAMNLELEDVKLRDRYGRGTREPVDDGAHR